MQTDFNFSSKMNSLVSDSASVNIMAAGLFLILSASVTTFAGETQGSAAVAFAQCQQQFSAEGACDEEMNLMLEEANALGDESAFAEDQNSEAFAELRNSRTENGHFNGHTNVPGRVQHGHDFHDGRDTRHVVPVVRRRVPIYSSVEQAIGSLNGMMFRFAGNRLQINQNCMTFAYQRAIRFVREVIVNGRRFEKGYGQVTSTSEACNLIARNAR